MNCDSTLNAADRAHSDLVVRVFNLLSQMEDSNETSFVLSIEQQELCIRFNCRTDNHSTYCNCIGLSTFISEDEKQAIKRSFIIPRWQDHTWAITSVSCGQPRESNSCKDFRCELQTWTFAGRLYSHHTLQLLKPKVGFPEDGWFCLVCLNFNDDEQHPLCNAQECQQCLDVFVSFACAMWSIKQFTNVDVALCIGCKMAAINHALCVMLRRK